MKNTKKILFIFVMLVMAAGAGCQGIGAEDDRPGINASGTLSSDEIKIASEIGGLLVEIGTAEGDEVKKGDLLAAVDDQIFLAEKARAEAGLKAAQAAATAAEEQVVNAVLQYQLALQGAEINERVIRSAEWEFAAPPEIDLPVWYFQNDEQLDVIRGEVDVAIENLDDQKRKLSDVLDNGANQDFLEVERELHAAQLNFFTAKSTLEKTRNAAQREELLEVAEEAYDAALANLESAQLEYDRELSTEEAESILEIRAKVAAAQADLDYLNDKLLAAETGDESLQVRAAEAGIDLAETALLQAQAAVEQAQAGLNVLRVQENKFQTVSPVDGVVLSLNVREGEVTGQGSTLMTIASLDVLDLVVYVSEVDYGKVDLGQRVDITVDSYPDEVFLGEVIHISDQAEYTPRNVQTVDGRKSTVFAIKIQVENSTGELKPGMPADVVFE